MNCSPLSVVAAASVAPLVFGQAFVPTAHAQAVSPPAYRARVDWQKATPSPGGLVIRGRVTNTGTSPLTYTQVTPTLVDHAGKEVFRGSGYITVSPLQPGQSAEFRACEPSAPRFAALRMVFHEAGHPVLLEQPRVSASVKERVPSVKTALAF